MRVVFLSLCLVSFVIANPIELSKPSPEDHELDLVQIVVDLFSARDDRAVTNENEDEGSATDRGDKKTKLIEITDKKVHKKYNALVDDVYKGMNERLKSGGMDPMVLNINKARANLATQQRKREEKKAERKSSHGVEKREVEEEEEITAADTDLQIVDEAKIIKDNKNKKNMNKDDKKNNKDNKKNNKDNKKNNKKDFLLNKNKENKNKDNKKKENKRQGKNKKASKNGKGNKNKENKNEENKNKENKNKENKNKENKNKENKNKENKRQGRSEKKEMGTLSGIASLRRDGDVSVYRNVEGTDIIKSEFTLGPLSLQVSKSNGGVGKAQNIKIARAVTEKLKGKMVIKVKKDGSTHVKSVQFEKPQQVDVQGSLGLNEKERRDLATRSIAKMRPVAAQRLLKIAKSIFKNKTSVEEK